MAKQKNPPHSAGKGKSVKAKEACPPDKTDENKKEERQPRSVGIGIPLTKKEMAEWKKRSEELDP